MIKVYKDSQKEWRWHYVASNGEILANGTEGYKNKVDLLHALTILFGLNYEMEVDETDRSD